MSCRNHTHYCFKKLRWFSLFEVQKPLHAQICHTEVMISTLHAGFLQSPGLKLNEFSKTTMKNLTKLITISALQILHIPP